MNRRYRFLFVAHLLILFSFLQLSLVSCVDDDNSPMGRHGNAKDGLVINFDIPDYTVVTRANSDNQNEYLVKQAVVWVFNAANGNLLFGPSLADMEENPSDDSGQPKWTFQRPIPINLIEEKHIANLKVNVYAVANFGLSNSSYKNKENGSIIDDNLLQTLNTEDALKKYMVGLNDYTKTLDQTLEKKHLSLFRSDDAILMSGFLAASDTLTDSNGKVKKYWITNTDHIDVKLKRVDAKIKVNIIAGDNVTIHPKRWRAQNIPAESFLFDQGEKYSTDVKVLSYDVDSQDGWYAFTSDPNSHEANYSFSFFSPESHFMPDDDKFLHIENTSDYQKYMGTPFASAMEIWKKYNQDKKDMVINDVDDEDLKYILWYKVRDLQERSKNNDYKDKYPSTPSDPGWLKKNPSGKYKFVVAPEKAPFIEFYADVAYTKNGNTSFAKDAKFIFHLGYGRFENTGRQSYRGNINDYSVHRNTQYTYNIKVTGLNDIRVEVEQNNNVWGTNDVQTHTGYEAHVQNTSARIDLDSHYDEGVVCLNYKTLKGKYFKDGMWDFNPSVMVKTPYYEKGNTGLTAGQKDGDNYVDWLNQGDTKWLHFVFNDVASTGSLEESYQYYIPKQYWGNEKFHPLRIVRPRNTLGQSFPTEEANKILVEHKRGLNVGQFTLRLKEILETATKWEKEGKQNDLWKLGIDPSTGDFTVSVYTDEYYYQDYNYVKSVINGNYDAHSHAIAGSDSYSYIDETFNSHTEQIANQDNWNKNGWRTFVNKPDRTCLIYNRVQNNYPAVKFSADATSSWNEPIVFVSQHSIVAPYNINNLPKDFIGFGYEVKEEMDWTDKDFYTRAAECHTVPAKYDNFVNYENTTQQLYNGWKKYLILKDNKWLESFNWQNAIIYPNEYNQRNAREGSVGVTHPAEYRLLDGEALYAPLIRNYDLNNDGKVENDEVKWYLPTLEQYEQIWLSEGMVSANYRLKKNDKIFYYSSKSLQGYGGKYALVSFKPQYGGSIRPSYATATHITSNPIAYDETPYSYYLTYKNNVSSGTPTYIRACRQLGTNNPDEAPENFINRNLVSGNEVDIPKADQDRAFTNQTDAKYCMVLDCSAMPSLVLRNSVVSSGPLPYHTIDDKLSYPAHAFMVASKSYQYYVYRGFLNPAGWSYYTMAGFEQAPDSRINVSFGKPDTYYDDANSLFGPRVDNNNCSKPERMFDRQLDPCRYYVEYVQEKDGTYKGITGWRTPNARELMLMFRFIPEQYKMNFESRGNRTYTIRNWEEWNGYVRSTDLNWGDLPSLPGKESLRASSYTGAYYSSSTSVNFASGERGYFYAADFYAGLNGFRAQPIKNFRESYFDVRCVKDLSIYEVQQMHSNNSAGSRHMLSLHTVENVDNNGKKSANQPDYDGIAHGFPFTTVSDFFYTKYKGK